MKGSRWVGGLAEWEQGETTYLSVAFTWKLDEAYTRAVFARALGRTVIAGGPALFLVKMQHVLADVAHINNEYPDAIIHHNPSATIASRGCPVGCWFCIVPKMEGRDFTLLPDFPVRPVLCDNNLSALPAEYQEHILARYRAEGVPLLDANSGFEPLTFTEEVYRRWRPLLNAGGGPWRFAYDELRERELGYAKLITYIREDEPGISLAASGWTYEGPIRARSWDMPGRRRIDKTEIVRRGRWSVQLGTPCPITWPIMTDVPLELELASGPPPAGE